MADKQSNFIINAQRLSTFIVFIGFTFLSCLSFAADSQISPPAWSGSYSEMLKRGLIRVAVPYDRTIYVNDKGMQRGMSVDVTRALTQWINDKYISQLAGKKITIKLVPCPKDQLLSTLTSGQADMVIGDLGLHESIPNAKDYLVSHASKLENEVLVTGPSSPSVTTFSDLSGHTVYGSRNTNFHTTLRGLNKELQKAGKPVVSLISPLGDLDDEDLLEMLDAGLIPFVIVSDWKAKLWQPIYTKNVVHHDLSAQDAGWIGWAVRVSNQDLHDDLQAFYLSDSATQAINAFRQQDYKQHLRGLKDPIEKTAWARFESMQPLFNQYGAEYKLNPLFIAALGFQETLLNQNAVSGVGALGVMQLMPATGASLNVGDIHLLGPNIHAGAKYMDQLINKNFPNIQFQSYNRSLFAVASYNIGPNNVAKARVLALQAGFDPNQWFQNVEFIAAQKMGFEPINYVRNVYKYFISYQLKLNQIQSIQP
jgi:membrane-bound lytic murein transglycosylase MltF